MKWNTKQQDFPEEKKNQLLTTSDSVTHLIWLGSLSHLSLPLMLYRDMQSYFFLEIHAWKPFKITPNTWSTRHIKYSMTKQKSKGQLSNTFIKKLSRHSNYLARNSSWFNHLVQSIRSIKHKQRWVNKTDASPINQHRPDLTELM